MKWKADNVSGIIGKDKFPEVQIEDLEIEIGNRTFIFENGLASYSLRVQREVSISQNKKVLNLKLMFQIAESARQKGIIVISDQRSTRVILTSKDSFLSRTGKLIEIKGKEVINFYMNHDGRIRIE